MLPGETVGSRKPWPHWVYDDTTLDQVGTWLRDYHQAVMDFSPDPSSSWRGGSSWSPGLIIGHNDAAPYNAAWQDGHLQGFFDWDFAGPVTPCFDLAFCCMSWVPLHARQVAEAEGFRDFTRRPQRLRRLLDAYGWEGDVEDLRRLMMEVVVRHIRDVEALAASGEPSSAWSRTACWTRSSWHFPKLRRWSCSPWDEQHRLPLPRDRARGRFEGPAAKRQLHTDLRRVERMFTLHIRELSAPTTGIATGRPSRVGCRTRSPAGAATVVPAASA